LIFASGPESTQGEEQIGEQCSKEVDNDQENQRAEIHRPSLGKYLPDRTEHRLDNPVEGLPELVIGGEDERENRRENDEQNEKGADPLDNLDEKSQCLVPGYGRRSSAHDCLAYTDDRGPFFDRNLEILGHSHGELAKMVQSEHPPELI
jgi:hypothetical protein